MFLTGPGVVRDALGEDVTAAQLGGTRVHERNGVCHFVAPTDVNAALLARELLGYLPRHRDARPPVLPARPPLGHDPSDPVPEDGRAASTTCATWSARSSTAASCSRCPRAGRATSSRGSRGSTAAPSA